MPTLSMARKIPSKLPTLLRHKLQSKMAHFAVLAVRKSIKLYEIALHTSHLDRSLLLKMSAIVYSPRSVLGDMEFFGTHQNENQIYADGS